MTAEYLDGSGPMRVLHSAAHHMITMENPTNMRKVELMPSMAKVQKLMSPSSERIITNWLP